MGMELQALLFYLKKEQQVFFAAICGFPKIV